MVACYRALEVLDINKIHYSLIRHRESSSSHSTAVASIIPKKKLVKAVILKDEFQQPIMALLSANQKINLRHLNHTLNRRFALINEDELNVIFHKSTPGAIAPIADAVYMDSIVEQSLVDLQEVYMEAGDHINLIHMDAVGFRKLIGESKKASFAETDYQGLIH
jgi:Ala-tRNA(Pro) deacylase